MAEVLMLKTPTGYVPSSQDDADRLKRHKVGKIYRLDLIEMRNSRFHRKFFALLNVGFDAWEPDSKEYKGEQVLKNFERFREDCTILAGFYEATYDINGNVKLKAKSISFANMEDDEFEHLYSKVIDVLLHKVLKNYNRADLDNVVDQILGFV